MENWPMGNQELESCIQRTLGTAERSCYISKNRWEDSVNEIGKLLSTEINHFQID